jgi:hypothetical protein
MSSRTDRSQGMVEDPKRPQARKVHEPDGVKILAGIGRAVKATDAAETKPRPAQRLRDLQDWKRG